MFPLLLWLSKFFPPRKSDTILISFLAHGFPAGRYFFALSSLNLPPAPEPSTKDGEVPGTSSPRERPHLWPSLFFIVFPLPPRCRKNRGFCSLSFFHSPEHISSPLNVRSSHFSSRIFLSDVSLSCLRELLAADILFPSPPPSSPS